MMDVIYSATLFVCLLASAVIALLWALGLLAFSLPGENTER